MAARTDDKNAHGEDPYGDMTDDQRQAIILEVFALGLEKEAEGRVGLKKKIEDRWIEDIRQDSGRYPSELEAKIKAAKGSEAFANLTKPKRQIAESRLADMLFPTDDRNFAIRHTPVVDMVGGDKPATIKGKPIATDENPEKPLTVKETFEAVAKERAENMQKEIEDQLIEAKYHKVGREIIRDACLLGTGVLKGPIIISRSRQAWVPVNGQDEQGNEYTEYEFKFIEEKIPTCSCVDPFHFFPDPSADSIENSISEFERHYLTKKQMIELSRRPDFIPDQVREVLKNEPNETPPNYLSLLRELAGQEVESTEKRYLVWEYHGPVTKEQIQACGCEIDEEDELIEYEAVVFVSGGKVLKAKINPMDTNERPYNVFNYEEDYASIFGYGVPYVMRNSQKSVNGAWRMTLENGGLSTGPIIVVNDQIVEPVKIDGVIDWNLTPRKLFRMKDPSRSVTDAFAAFNIEGHIAELKDIMGTAKQLCDLETNLPLVNQADEAPKNQALNTFRGMELLMNSNNVPMRRAVKNFDDNITVPFITRWYNYNMQFSKKPEIKGDFQVDARGSGALLLKETQARNIYNVTKFANTKALSPLTKWPGLYRIMVQSAQLDPDDVVMTDEEIKTEQEKKKDGAQDIERMKIEANYAMHREKLENDKINRDAQLLMKQMEQTMMILQNEKLMEVEGMKGELKLKEIIMKTQGDRQKIADEALIKAQFGSGI